MTLGRSDDEFWRMTLAQIDLLLNVRAARRPAQDPYRPVSMAEWASKVVQRG